MKLHSNHFNQIKFHYFLSNFAIIEGFMIGKEDNHTKGHTK